MDLDVSVLRWATLEALERLARALQVPVPPDYLTREERHRRLARAIATVLLNEKRLQGKAA